MPPFLITRSAALSAAIAPVFAVAQPVLGASPAADYPYKPVRIISPFAPGGGTDTVGRAVAQRLSEEMGRTFVVDNRSGAEGVIGTELGAKAARTAIRSP